MNELFDDVELELRRIPGVQGVGVLPGEEGIVVSAATEDDRLDRTELRRHVAHAVRGVVQGPVAIEIERSSPPPAPAVERPVRPPRVKLVEVEVEPYSSDVIVRLTHDGRHAVGRGEAGSPSDAAAATVRALNALGAKVPFSVKAMSSPVGHSPDQAVVVLLESDDVGSHRYGVARAGTVEEAACRATLHALNRWLADERVFAESA